MSKIINVGRVTAYADAVKGGYQGTREEWENDLANLGTTAAEVEADRQEVAANTAAVATDKDIVEGYKNAANLSAQASAASAGAAHTDALAATAAKEASETAQGLAESAKDSAVAAKGGAETAQGAAEAAVTQASGYADNASASATAAAGSATAAAGSATDAAASATAAAGSADEAEAVLESIPADYSTLSNDVADLKSALNAVEKDSTLVTFEWERGSFTSAGANTSSTKRYRTIEYYYFDANNEFVYIKVPSGWKVSYYYYNSANAHQGHSDYYSKDLVFKPSYYRYRFLIGKTDDSDVDAELTDFPQDFAIYSYVGKIDDTGIYGNYNSLYSNVVLLNTDASLFTRQIPKWAGANTLSWNSSTTRIATNPVVDVRSYDRWIHVKPDAGYKYIIYELTDETHYTYDALTAQWADTEKWYMLNSNTKYLVIGIAASNDAAINTSVYNRVRVEMFAKGTVPLRYILAQNTSDIEVLKTGLPAYWQTYMDSKADDLNTADAELGYNGCSFAFVTDVHVATNYMKSPLLIKYILEHTSIDRVICGGDIISNYDTKANALEQLAKWRNAMAGTDERVLYGNHDGNSNNQTDSTAILPESVFYGYYNRQVENTVKWVPGELNGYEDNEAQKIRFIYLNTGAPDNAVLSMTQVEWMQNRITELQSGWTVIVFAHQYFNPDTTLDGNGSRIGAALDSIYDSMDATLAAVVVGHCHTDHSAVSEKGYPIIATTCDTGGGSGRTEGTTSEQAFDLFYVNTTARTINTIRIGAGEDRSFTY